MRLIIGFFGMTINGNLKIRRTDKVQDVESNVSSIILKMESPRKNGLVEK